MHVNEFAARILHSSSIAEKLAPPPEGLDFGPSARVPAGVEFPERPPELRVIDDRRDRGARPGESELASDAGPGRLLHYFANHELLAVELMALAVLKFPDAPTAFRRGLIRTLRDEQEHTRWYLERMSACGVSFGEFPVNGFFWKVVAGMESPIDYVVRLPLTFEQANLDFSLHYRDAFQRAGDSVTAELFQQIHDDEIAHVGYGLRWFRRWKASGTSDWSAFSSRLDFPLSPSRAKGRPPFDVQGRLKAGLSRAFIRDLELFSRSRGRTPCVFYFNPQAESILASPDGRPDRTSEILARDLELLPIVLARPDDLVLIHRAPRTEHLEKLASAGIALPEMEILGDDDRLAPDSLTARRKLGGLRPWAWSPILDPLFGPLARHVGGAARGMGWRESLRPLFSKAFGASILAGSGDPDAGVMVDSLPALRSAFDAVRQRGFDRAVIKPEWGVAGRGHRRWSGDSSADDAWAEGILRSGRRLLIEPWFERVAEFSLQADFNPGRGIQFKGFVALECDAGGKFIACRASTRLPALFPGEIARFLNADGRGPWLRAHYETHIFPGLESAFAAAGFQGAFGIDAFIFRAADGSLRLRPVVEVNPRFTIGRVTLELLRAVAPARIVRFSLAHLQTMRAEGCQSLVEFAALRENANPPSVALINHQPRLSSGLIVLTDPRTALRFLAIMEVSPFEFGRTDHPPATPPQ